MIPPLSTSVLWVITLLLLLSTSSFANTTLVPVNLFNEDKYPLNAHLQVLEDKTNQLTIDQVSSPQFSNQFIPGEQRALNLGISQSTYWIKLKLLYPNLPPNTKLNKHWFLEIGRSNLSIVDMFLADDTGGYTVTSSDMRSVYNEREVMHVNSVFPLLTTLDEEVTIYFRVKSDTSIYLPVTLWERSAFVTKVSIEEYLYGLFTGCMLALFVYNFFLYLLTRDISYLYYTLYLISISMFELLESGHGTIQFGQLFGVIEREYVLLFVSSAVFFATLFIKTFLGIIDNHPRLNAVLNVSIAIILLTFIGFFATSYQTSSTWNMIFFGLFTIIFLSITLYCWSIGNQNAKYVFIAWIFNVIGFTIFAGVANTAIPATTLTLSAIPIGLLIESILLALALANRIKTEQTSFLLADKRSMESLTRYQSIFNNSREGRYKMSLSGSIVSANQALVKLFGFNDLDELMRHNEELTKVIFESCDDRPSSPITNGVFSNELLFQRKGSSKIWASHSAKLIKNKAGENSHIEGTLTNITQIKLKELALREKEQERVEKNIAEASTQAKSEFLANMSHEIRTPLTAIIGFSESLQDESTPKQERQESIQLVVQKSRDLLQIINDILDFSKIEADKLEVEALPVNIVELVDKINDEFSAKAEDSNIKFDVIYRYPFPSVILSDPTRIQQVLTNLCSNAVKFTEQGSVVLSVFWDKETKQMKFEVLDSGLGIKKSIQQNMFQVFGQADTSSTRKYGGAGLGLAVSNKLAALMGGSISVSSKVDKGSVFTFSVDGNLPKEVKWRNRPRQKAATKKTQKTNTAPQLQGTVLLAEDNVVNQKLIERILKKSGLEVIVAINGVEACEYCEKRQPDLVLMDINMPERDGIEATKQLRQKGLHMPIFALTAEQDRSETDKALQAGCVGILSKPLNTNELFNALKTHLPALPTKVK